MTTSAARNDRDRLAAEYVMGLLEGEERRRAERLAESDAAFQAAVAHWQRRFAEIDEAAPSLAAGDALWQRIEAGLSAEAAPLQVDDPTPVIVPSPRAAFTALWRSLHFWRLAGLTAAFASLLLAVGVGVLATRAAREPVLIAVLLTEENRPAAVLNAFANGAAELVPLEGMQLPSGRALEVWAFPEPGGRPVSVGVLNELRSTRLDATRMPVTRPAQPFAVSLEPRGGSPTGLPTGPVVMRGHATTAL